MIIYIQAKRKAVYLFLDGRSLFSKINNISFDRLIWSHCAFLFSKRRRWTWRWWKNGDVHMRRSNQTLWHTLKWIAWPKTEVCEAKENATILRVAWYLNACEWKHGIEIECFCEKYMRFALWRVGTISIMHIQSHALIHSWEVWIKSCHVW